LEKLKSNPKRQAIHTLRGYAYQIWQTVVRWTHLKENEVLYLEGAEDIDLLCEETAETIQVKNIRKSITLKSQEILDSIVHFWEHKQNNQDVKVSFRFLTTAKRGKEKGSPFGDRYGLDYWDDCKRPDSNITTLRKFLQKQALPSSTLQKFISSSSDKELRENIIKCIEWDTGNEPQDFLEELIKKKVSYYGKDYNIPPSESEKVVPHLLQYVWRVIHQSKERRLEYYDFMRVFDEATRETVPKHELNRLKQIESRFHGSLSLGESEKSGFMYVDAPLSLVPPPLPQRLSTRKKLINQLISNLDTQGLIVLQGSAGMGKSTLAKLFVHNDDDSWKWLDMRGLKPEQVKERLFQVASHGASESTEKAVIDDLNFGNQYQIYENALLSFMHVVLSRGGLVILTAQMPIPRRIALHFGPI